MNIPQYKSLSGEFFPVSDIIKDHKILRIDNTTAEECIAYTKALENNGYTLYEANEIPASTDKNLFYIYKCDNCVLSMFWIATYNRLYIATSATETLPIAKRFADITDYETNPEVVQLKLSQGYVWAIKMRDSSIVLIDGDLRDDKDTTELYNYLKENAKPDKKVRIDLWIFTHPDVDHISLTPEFLKDYGDKVEISAFAYQFLDSDKAQYTYIAPEIIQKDIVKLEENISKYCPNTPVYSLHAGQKFYYSGAEIEILFTADILYPLSYRSANDASAALRVSFENGKKAIFLGDCMKESCEELANIYGDYLKSHIMQVTHHGLLGGELGLYKLVNPEFCLWSTSESRFSGTFEAEAYHYCLGEGGCDYNAWLRDDSIRKREHYHLGETAVIQI